MVAAVLGGSCVMAGCDAVGPTAPRAPFVQEIVLAPGETASVDPASVRVRFDRVTSDSRCPADVVCIVAGDAIVRVVVIPDRGGERQYDLHTGDMKPLQAGGLAIGVVQLQPYPVSARPIQPGDYRATLRITG